jgi:pimeloyl-ACP methyl ester carboxylesterase
MPLARVNDCNIYYEMHGSGPDLVFVHGETHSAALFDEQIRYFSQRYRCLVYDRRGHRRSELTPYGYSLWNQTNDLISLMEMLQVQRAVIVAVAMSTPLAVSYALERSSAVRALALASWYELDGYPLLERRRQKHAMSFGDLHLLMLEKLRSLGRAGLKRYMDREYEKVFPIFPEDAIVRTKLIDIFASHPPGHYVKSGEYYTSLPNLLPAMSEISCPILGICGRDDPSPDRPELLQHLANFKEVWIKGARRFTMMEAPEEFNSALESFLGELPP